jgi:hypothetical protein
MLSISAARSTALAFTVLVAGLAASSCGGEESDLSDPVAPGAIAPGDGDSTLNPRACAAVARGGKVAICHTADLQAIPASALTVPVEACGTIHAEHADDFLADEDGGCLQAKKKCIATNKPCKLSNPGACCSLNCGPNTKGKIVCR